MIGKTSLPTSRMSSSDDCASGNSYLTCEHSMLSYFHVVGNLNKIVYLVTISNRC